MNGIKKKWLFLIVTLVLSLGIVGCANNTPIGDLDIEEKVDDLKDATSDTIKDAKDNVRDIHYEDITVSPEEAFDKFMALHPDAKIEEIELDKELMTYQYVIKGYDDIYEYKIKMNPVDGKVSYDHSEARDVDDDDDITTIITKDLLAKIDRIIDQAKIEDGSNSQLDEWTISSDDGRILMAIEIGAMEYSYDMATEKLIEKDI